MKMIKNILSVAVLLSGMSWTACTEDWDNHYSEKEQIVDNVNITVVDASLLDYLKSEPSLSSMYTLFEETGSIETMRQRDQLFTVLVVKNEHIVSSEVDKAYLAKSHIADVSLSPANLSNGQRILMWNGKYLNVAKQENEQTQASLSFNETKVNKVIKLKDGYVYELESYVNSPQSMYEFIESLGDDYSTFRELILSKNEKVFDKNASIPIGVDNTGSTVYDSVFVVSNSYFAGKGMDLMSESINATMLLPSNTLMEKARTEALSKLNAWGLLGTEALQARADTIVDVWILQAAFFDKRFFKQDFVDNEDLNSIFSRQWRTTVQALDLDQPIELSNGVVYHITDLKIPTNVLIYRLKDYMKWYEFLSAEDKGFYFNSQNLVFSAVTTKVEAWSGWPAAGFPAIENRLLFYKQEDYTLPYELKFTPFQYKDTGAGSYSISPYRIPPGEYDLCMGFEQKMGHDVTVYFNGTLLRTITTNDLTSTTFHYDRGAGEYPEGYDTKKATNSKKGNYDRDGGKVGTVTINGTDAIPVEIMLTGKAAENGTLRLHHWCLKPTKNCY